VVLAVLVHGVLLAFLWIGVSWQSDVPIQTEAEIWSPQGRQTALAAVVPPPAAPVAVKVVRAPVQAPAPPPPVRLPETDKKLADPDIALEKKRKQREKEHAEDLKKEKLEDEKVRRREAEERRIELEKERTEELKAEKRRLQEAEDSKKQLETERLEALKKEKLEEEKVRRQEAEERQRQLLAEQEKKKRAEEEKKRAEEERRKQVQAEEEKKKLAEAERQKLAEEQKRKQEEAAALAAAQRAKARREEDMRRLTGPGGDGDAEKSQGNRVDAGYAKVVGAKIKSNTIASQWNDVNGNPAVEFIIELQPDGTLREARISQSSGVPAFDLAVKRAIEKSSPFPADANGKVPSSFILSHRLKDN